MRFSALFGEIFGQTALSSLQLLKGNFSGASLSYREDARNGAYGFPFLSGTRISNHLQMSQLRRQHIVLRYLRLRKMVQSRAWTLDLRRFTTWTKQAAVFESLLTFFMLFTHITDIDLPDTIDTWRAVTCHKPHNPLLTKSENRMLMAHVWKTHLS